MKFSNKKKFQYGIPAYTAPFSALHMLQICITLKIHCQSQI
jgi:hypothetical protein